MSFGAPHFLWLLLPMVAIFMCSSAALKRRSRDLNVLGIQHLLSLHSWRHYATLSAVTLLLVALAQPRSEKTLELGYEVQAEVVFVLDLSVSMLAQDVAPSRLRRAQSEIASIVSQLENCRYALVVFANTAYPRLPLTSDKQSFLKAVMESDPEQFQSQGSHLAAGIQTALGVFDSSSNRVIVVVSDGEDLEQTIFRIDQNIELPPIYTLGVGTTVPSPMPLINGSNHTDSSGNVALTRRQDAALIDLAKRSSGAHMLSVNGDRDRDTIADAIMRNQGQQMQLQGYTEYFPWFASLAGALLLLAFAPPSSLLVNTSIVSLPLLVAVVEADEWSNAAVQRWNTAHHNQDRLQAAAEQALDQNSNAEATFMYERLLEMESHNQRHRVQLSVDAGLAAAQSGRFNRAIYHWELALSLDPSSEEASHNHRVLSQRMADWKVESNTESTATEPVGSKTPNQDPAHAELLTKVEAQRVIDSVREGRTRGRYGGGSDARHPW